MRLTGDELEASAPVACQRADFLLLAYTSMDSNPSVLGFAYHTTNVVPGTSSNKTTQAYPETCVLWKMNVPLTGLMEEAATSLAEALLLPTPREESEIKDILDPQVWEETVLKPADATMRDASGDAETSTSDRTSDSTESSDDSDDDSESGSVRW